MKTLEHNGEYWYIDDRSLWKRCRQWLIWIGGWEKANGKGWKFLIDYGHRKGLMSPSPISLLGHHITFFGWGWQIKIRSGYYLVWSKSGLYISNDGTPPRSDLNKGFFIYRNRRRRAR